MRWLLIAIMLCVFAAPIVAQEDRAGVFDISFGSTVRETITDRSFFDWWRLNAFAGDIIVVEMTGEDGLAPLVGLLDVGGNLIVSSDEFRIMDVNETAVLEYTAQQDGQYTIVATRNGLDQGDTAGSYRLTVFRGNQDEDAENIYVQVEFRCREFIATTASIISFEEQVFIPDDTPPGQVTEAYRFTVFGLDGFQPIIRIEAPLTVPDNYLDCSDDAQALVGSTYTLPDGSIGMVTEDSLDSAAQVSLVNSGPGEPFGPLDITIGSKDGQPGRYMAVIQGLSIAEADQMDLLTLRQGPSAVGTPAQVYMVGDSLSRLDPFVEWRLDLETGEVISTCDDANRRGCEGVPSFVDAGMTIYPEEPIQVIGDRFDAGLRFMPPSSDPIFMNLMSRDNITHGEYSLVIIGELPARE